MGTNRLTRGLLLAVLGVALAGTPTAMAAGPTRVTSHAQPRGHAAAAAGTTWMVDDDGMASVGNCDSTTAASSTVQGAIDGAHDGDTILVCPGVYPEQVTVVGFTGLKIMSTVPLGAVIKTPSVLHAPYLVGIGISTDVTFQGFRLRILSTETDCQPLDFGILTSEALRIVIRGNHLETNGAKTLTGPCGYLFGIQVGEPTFFFAGPTAVANHRPSWAAIPAGGLTSKSRAVVSSNLVSNFQFAGISVSGKGANAAIIGNSLHYFHARDPGADFCFLPISRVGMLAAAARLAGFGSVGGTCLGLGIVQVDRAGGIIQGNVARGATGTILSGAPAASPAVLFAGILQWNQRHEHLKSAVLNNRVFDSIAGIALLDGDGSHVMGNRTYDSIIGVFIHQTKGVTIERNWSNHNGVGFGVNDIPIFGTGGPDDFGRTSSDNVFKNNDATKNDLLGHATNPDGFSTTFISCFDNTIGTAVHGTANWWLTNLAEPNSSDPLAICGSVAP